MKPWSSLALSVLLAAPLAACTDLDAPEQASALATTSQQIGADYDEAREQLAASGRFQRPVGGTVTAASAEDMARALDIDVDDDIYVTSRLSNDNTLAAGVMNAFGMIVPRQGDSFVVLSNGILGEEAEPGVDFGAVGTGDDAVTLSIDLLIPPGVTRMSFQYHFLSAEYPDFIGSAYNDTFTARLSNTPNPLVTASVNSAIFHDAANTIVDYPTGYMLYVDDPSGVDEIFGTNAYPDVDHLYTDAGVTDFQYVDAPVTAGPVTLTFDIRDLGDGIVDSAVIIDNIRFAATEIVDPNPVLLDPFDGSVRSGDPEALATLGRAVNAVAADGTTQLLVRTNLPSPGAVTYALDLGHAGDGGFGPVTLADEDDWQDTVTVSTVTVGAKHYAFALFRSPADFNGGGDEDARSRTLPFTVTYEPRVGVGFAIEQSLVIVRPPVVVVHDIWGSCQTWDNNSIFHHDRPAKPTSGPFTVTCAGYENSKSFHTNRKVMSDYITQAIHALRQTGAAVTQVDLIGHGMGGLLARRYVDGLSYFRDDNFYEGDIHRLITVNTPHLGARMADAMVDTRTITKATPATGGGTEWDRLKSFLKNDLEHPILMDDADGDTAIDELRTGSPVLGDLNETPVPSHVLVSTGGRVLSKGPALSLLDGGIKTLYTNIDYLHPLAKSNPTNKGRIIFGPTGKVFCSDEHDLFATEWDQAGGLAVDPASRFPVQMANRDSEHFKVHVDQAHTDRLIELLNSPLGDDGPFAPSLPAPSSVEAVNSCPPAAAAASEPPVRTLADGTLRIVSPSPGTVVTPGSTVTVTVEATGFEPTQVLIVGGARTVLLEAAPFVVDLEIPEDAIGSATLMAAGFSLDILAYSDEVRLPIQVTASVDTLDILEGNLVLSSPGAARQLTVLGGFSDGVVREVTASEFGTRYVSTNPGIATVSNEGRITAAGPGITTVVVRNGLAITSVNVEVKDGGFAPVAVCQDVTVAADASCQAQASIDGGSHDPDELPQPLVMVQTPPGPFAPGVHSVGLEVSDGANSDSCTATVTVVDSAAPALSGCEDVFVDATPGLGGAYLSYAIAATDNCEGSVPVACDVVSGSFFAMGESAQVTCASADSGGHQATCTFSVEVLEPATCEASDPRSQDYWRTQCNYRDPEGTPPDPFLSADILQRLLDQVEGVTQAVCGPGENTCDALNPDPYWETCERACQEYAAWLLNIASARVPASCCNYGGTAADAAAHVADLIATGQCAEAVSLAYDLNSGCEYCEGGD
ncbi:choice-of-anchor L domain-containing protein [Haliangium ochraceum]|uniref:PGAP1 family protein n=1 Tax=Haliangium ochraceum (strain DSM 14365 / JCM 11303 / SMP-2) TaxID=502025 RepID=D0LPC2_HALO1|nr:choice-of-anchor L domain-containing protein [Haliangium ochraceum]ACY13487.1 PGAP1 family protein [Haliangium ochraceum DSM 14365]